MFESIKDNLLFPILTRIGTFAGAGLVGLGMTETQANHVVLGGTALLLFGVDLIASYYNRKRERTK